MKTKEVLDCTILGYAANYIYGSHTKNLGSRKNCERVKARKEIITTSVKKKKVFSPLMRAFLLMAVRLDV